MRTVDFEIAGVKYPLCFTLGAFCQICDRYGCTLEEYLNELDRLMREDQKKGLEEYIWLLHTLLQAGWDKATYDQEEPPTPPGMDELKELVCFGDLSVVIQAIHAGNTREVGAQPAKNGEGAGAEG